MDRERDIQNARVSATKESLRAFFELVDAWELSLHDQKILLGERALMNLSKQLDGDSEIVIDDQTMATLVLLNHISKKIGELKPTVNANDFVRTSHANLNGKTPLDTILEDPKEGIPKVNKYLMLMTINTNDAVFG